MNTMRTVKATRWLVPCAVLLILTSSLFAEDEAGAIDLSLRDTEGTQLTVPAAEQVTLLLFLRTEHKQSDEILTRTEKALEGLPAAQVIIVLSGEQSDEAVAALAGQTDRPIVIDPEYEIIGQFSIHVWPTSMVVLADGRELTRVSGVPKAYLTDLSAWLAFAAGEIDRAELEERMAAAEVVADTPQQKARRHLQVARRLLDKGLLAQAMLELDKGLELQPEDQRLRLAQARGWLLQGEPDKAMDVLDLLDEGSSLAAKIGVLKGGALVQLGEWDQAIRTLRIAIRLNPDPAEAYYFLGVAYQNKQQWQEAAEAFGKAYEATPAGRLVALSLHRRDQEPVEEAPAEPGSESSEPTPDQPAEPEG